LGPNGSGKSTLVAVLAGLLPPDAGRVVVDGTALDDAATGLHLPPERRSVGVLFQDLLLFPHLSAEENVAFPLRARGSPKAEALVAARALLERLGVAHRAHAQPRALSGGEAQRVALARALIVEPAVLLLDEPTSALDMRTRSQVRPLVESTLRGFPGERIVVTHDPVEAMTLADRLVVLENGEVTQRGAPEELRRAPRTPYVAELVGVNLFVGRLEALEEGAARLVASDGEVVVPWPREISPGAEVIGVLRPADVALHLAPPPVGSARNVLRGRVTAISIEGERARVRLDASPPVVAEVTLGSAARLGLRQGVEAWASFKALEVAVQLA
jgi:molybdate transport system ATP-binding protein